MNNPEFISLEEFIEKFKEISSKIEWCLKDGKIRGMNSNCCPLTFFINPNDPKPAECVGGEVYSTYGYPILDDFCIIVIASDKVEHSTYFYLDIRRKLLQACNLPSE